MLWCFDPGAHLVFQEGPRLLFKTSGKEAKTKGHYTNFLRSLNLSSLSSLQWWKERDGTGKCKKKNVSW